MGFCGFLDLVESGDEGGDVFFGVDAADVGDDWGVGGDFELFENTRRRCGRREAGELDAVTDDFDWDGDFVSGGMGVDI